MAIVKMSLHRVLGMLKANEDIINKNTAKNYVMLYKKSVGKAGGVPVNEVRKEVKGDYQQTLKLIKNNHALRSARAKSNAITIVNISGKEYTVADAIARKQSLIFEKNLLNTLKIQYSDVKALFDHEEERLSHMSKDYITSIISDKSNISPDKIAQLEKDYRELNKFEILDPISIADEIKRLEKDINEFEMEVDYVLSDSNAVTIVEVDID